MFTGHSHFIILKNANYCHLLSHLVHLYLILTDSLQLFTYWESCVCQFYFYNYLSALWLPSLTLFLVLFHEWKSSECIDLYLWWTSLVSVVPLLSYVQICETPWTAAYQSFLSFTIFLSLLKFMSIDSVMPSNHLILCHPLHLLPSIFFSIRVFTNELALRIRWPKYWSFSISPSNEYLRFTSFRTDWLDLLAVQGTLKGLLQHHTCCCCC